MKIRVGVSVCLIKQSRTSEILFLFLFLQRFGLEKEKINKSHKTNFVSDVTKNCPIGVQLSLKKNLFLFLRSILTTIVSNNQKQTIAENNRLGSIPKQPIKDHEHRVVVDRTTRGANVRLPKRYLLRPAA